MSGVLQYTELSNHYCTPENNTVYVNYISIKKFKIKIKLGMILDEQIPQQRQNQTD